MPMINYIQGDLFTTKDRLIAHGCNARGVMGSGVAASIKKMYPGAFEAYKMGPYDVMGTVIYHVSRSYDSRGTVIANCITQSEYGLTKNHRYVSYDALDTCMSNIHFYCIDNNIGSISIPKIGAGLGGGDWAVIEKIIQSKLDNILVNVYYL